MVDEEFCILGDGTLGPTPSNNARPQMDELRPADRRFPSGEHKRQLPDYPSPLPSGGHKRHLPDYPPPRPHSKTPAREVLAPPATATPDLPIGPDLALTDPKREAILIAVKLLESYVQAKAARSIVPQPPQATQPLPHPTTPTRDQALPVVEFSTYAEAWRSSSLLDAARFGSSPVARAAYPEIVLKILGHAWGLGGRVVDGSGRAIGSAPRTIELEGMPMAKLGPSVIAGFLQDFVETGKTLPHTDSAFLSSLVETLIRGSLYAGHSEPGAHVLNELQQRGLVIFPAGWNIHASAVAIADFGTCYIMATCNRIGAEKPTPRVAAIRFYSVDDRSKLTPDVLSRIVQLRTQPFSPGTTSTGLPEAHWIDDERSGLAHALDAKRFWITEMAPQKVGNCTWTSTEAAVFAGLFMRKLHTTHQHLQQGGTPTQPSGWRKAELIQHHWKSKQDYKPLTTFLRVQALAMFVDTLNTAPAMLSDATVADVLRLLYPKVAAMLQPEARPVRRAQRPGNLGFRDEATHSSPQRKLSPHDATTLVTLLRRIPRRIRPPQYSSLLARLRSVPAPRIQPHRAAKRY